MKIQISILLIVLLGFFLIPTQTFACGQSTEKIEKSCCEKETSKSDDKDCCKENSHKDASDDGCEGKCKDASCHCPSISISIALPFLSDWKNPTFFGKKHTILYLDTYISSGYLSIWLPPKIS